MPSDPRGRRLPGPLSILTAVVVLLIVAAAPLADATNEALLRPDGNGGSPAAAADMQLASTRVYYVSPRGSDRNPGTKARPWKSIYAAINKMTHGGHLYVRGGSYAYSGENIIGARRTGSTRVVISNYPGERPIFRTSSTQAIFMWFRNAAYITVSGLTVYGDLHAPTRVSHGGAIFQFTGNTSSIILSSNRAYGGPRWADTQHGVYIGAGTVRGVTIKSNLFDGRGGDGARLPRLSRPERPQRPRHGQRLPELGPVRPGLVEHPLPRDHPEQLAELPDRHPLSRVQWHPRDPQPILEEQHRDPAG